MAAAFSGAALGLLAILTEESMRFSRDSWAGKAAARPTMPKVIPVESCILGGTTSSLVNQSLL